MFLEFVLGFLVLVAASYVGTMMALRGFFGRERYAPPGETGGDGPPRDDTPKTGDAPKTNDAPKTDDTPKTDDVPRASDVSSDDAEDG